MSKFGWSYPAGCSGTPHDEGARPCDACGLYPDDDGKPTCADPAACDREMEAAEEEYGKFLEWEAALDLDAEHKYGPIDWAD